VLWRRAEYGLTGGWDETLSANQDGDLMLRALARGARLVRAAGGEAYYRSHGAERLSVGRDLASADKLRARMRVLEKLEEELTRECRLGEYAGPLGLAYHRLAVVGFQADATLARECLRRGEAFTGRRAVSRTWAGRLLTRVAGLERKERIAELLGRVGLMTRRRREVRAIGRLVAARTGQTVRAAQERPR
jgi:hypothetical protein